MNNNINIDFLYNKYLNFVNTVCNKYNYDNNIRHLMNFLLIIFVIKYGIRNEKTIMDCFLNTRIIVRNTKKDVEEAFFYRNLTFNQDYISNKYIFINNFNKENYIELIDTLIHEFNHAVNSMKNEIKIDEKSIYLRTGLSHIFYYKSDLNDAIDKDDKFILEEVINTKQTVDIINMIKEIDCSNIQSSEFYNFVNAVQQEIGNKVYISKAYFLENKILEPLINNKTFISTLEKLRFMGEISEVEFWFDSIVNKEKAYKRLNQLLKEIYDLEIIYINKKFFKGSIRKKINLRINYIKEIIDYFNENCIYR